MPALVARDLVASLADSGGHIVAGATAAGLDRSVEGVARPRRLISREYDAFDAHDLVVVALDAFSAGGDLSLAALITLLAESQAGLVVAGLPDRSAASDIAPYDLADRLAFPLITVPAALDLVEMARQIIDLIRQRQSQTARYVRDALVALSHARDPSDPLGALAGALARFTGLVFVLENEHRAIVAQALPEMPLRSPAEIAAALTSFAARQAVRPATPGALSEDFAIQRHLPGGLARAIVPLRAGLTPIGYLSLLGPEDRVTPRDIEVLRSAAPSFAFELGQRRTAAPNVRHTAAGDLAALLAGALTEAEAMRRAAERHCDIAQPHAVALALPGAVDGDTAAWAALAVERLAQQTPAIWATPHAGGVALLLPVTAKSAARDALARLFDPGAIAGLGRPGTGVAGLRRSLGEADQAAKIAQHLGEPVLAFEDLGIWRLLFPLRNNAVLGAFSHETLMPLLRGDTAEHDLLRTLAAWFAANGNLSHAAHDLSIHRNTLTYRLNRIQQLLGASLDDAEIRLALQVAIKIWEIEQHSAPGSPGRG
jgi:purine catabolism regulator